MMGQSDQTLGVSLWDYGSAWQGFHQGQKLHELSIPIVPRNMVICCNSMVYLLNIVISFRNVGLPEGTSHLSQWIPIYIYTVHHWISSFWKVPMISHQMNAWISTTHPAFRLRVPASKRWMASSSTRPMLGRMTWIPSWKPAARWRSLDFRRTRPKIHGKSLINRWLLVCFDEKKKDMWGFSWFSSAMHAPCRMMRYHSVWL